MKRYREKPFCVDFEPKNVPLPHSEDNKNFFKKIQNNHFKSLFKACHRYNFR